MRDHFGWFILDENHNVIPATDEEYREWCTMANRRVGDDMVDRVRISTVFLGLDHGNGFIFETLVFPYENMSEVDGCRYQTWEAAVEGHRITVERVRAAKTQAWLELGRPLSPT